MSQPQSSDKVANLQNDVDDVKVIMQDNIGLVSLSVALSVLTISL